MVSTGSNKDGIPSEDDELLALTELLDETSGDGQTTTGPITHKSASKCSVPRLREDSSFAEAFSVESAPIINKPKSSKNIDEIDSSDDEEVRNYLEQKYNEYGRDIKKVLKDERMEKHNANVEREVKSALNASNDWSLHVKNPHNPIKRVSQLGSSTYKPLNTVEPIKSNVYTDPVFGFRICNPLISSALLVERMKDRKSVSFASLLFYTQNCDLTKDWVVAGVIVSKTPIRMTRKGEPFSIWRLSDLRGDIKMISLFLFGGAHKELWKTAQGTCIAILNPGVLEKRAEGGDIASLSIDTSKKVMILGQSKDFGTCRAKKRNGDPCTAFVNLSECDYCIFHMKQEYGKMSKRSELQSGGLGQGLNELRNKVLGKSEVFYGGQSYMAVPAKKNPKLIKRDMDRLSLLSDYAVSPYAREQNHASKPKGLITSVPYAERSGAVSRIAGNVEIGTKQRFKDMERLKNLDESFDSTKDMNNSEKTIPKAKTTNSSVANTKTPESTMQLGRSVPDKFKDREFSFSKQTPRLSSDNFCIEVNVSSKQAEWSKQKAMQILKQKPLEKINPNTTRGSREGKRRAIDELNEKFSSNDEKRLKLDAEQHEKDIKSRLQRIMNATSSHSNLIAMREEDEREKYFNKLEKKEALEDKMLQTFKVPCKAVICLICKYTAFSAADRCKEQKHTLKVVDAEKRFFECGDCHNRTTTVFKLPKTSCKNCKSSNWQRAAMIRERKICDGTEKLSIRGDEEIFIGSLGTTASLNLIVPDE